MGVNWALGLQQQNAGDSFNQAFQQGQQQKQQNIAKQAMAALVADPNNQRALQALAQVDPASAQQFQQQKLEMARQQMGQHYDSVLKGAQLIRQMQPKDDASWQVVLQTAHQAGIDVSQVPQHYDPQYVQSVVQLADAFKPQADAQGKDIPYQAGGGVLHVNPDGTVRQLVVPNDGSQPAGAPVNGGQPLSDDDIRRMKGGQVGGGSPGGFL